MRTGMPAPGNQWETVALHLDVLSPGTWNPTVHRNRVPQETIGTQFNVISAERAM
jgi:hypothetical protein